MIRTTGTRGLGLIGGTGGSSFAVAATVSQGTVGLIAGSIVMVFITTIGTLCWLRALGQDDRSLRWVLAHTTSVSETEHLMRLLMSSHREVIRAGASMTPGSDALSSSTRTHRMRSRRQRNTSRRATASTGRSPSGEAMTCASDALMPVPRRLGRCSCQHRSDQKH